MKATQWIAVGVVCLFVGLSGVQGSTISFADPGFDGTIRWFSVDLVNNLVTAGWPDGNANGIEIVQDGAVVASSAFFTMTPLAYTGPLTGGYTSGGTIKFYEDAANPMTDAPIFQIDFDQAYISVTNLFASNDDLSLMIGGDGVVFSGALVGTAAGTPADVYQQTFGFVFANRQAINGDASVKGFRSTASFTSSYSPIIPEPATMGLLVFGAVLCRRRMAS